MAKVSRGSVACNVAAMLFYLHGLSQKPFDWAHRPFFLRFNTNSLPERQAAFRELCDLIDADASRFLD